jgi:hypothetical protein
VSKQHKHHQGRESREYQTHCENNENRTEHSNHHLDPATLYRVGSYRFYWMRPPSSRSPCGKRCAYASKLREFYSG